MKKILALSGKGGTGKTTISGSLAALMPDVVVADCDVDAADLHLLSSPVIKKKESFWSGVEAEIDHQLCTACGTCVELCRFDALTIGKTAEVLPFACEGCGVCAHFCPEKAISLQNKMCGEWYISETACGPLVHASLGIGEENSGKLVTLVKKKAQELAEEKKSQWILIDGPPGIGCPVIASMSGANHALLITEPSRSGLHDLKRVAELSRHFKIPVSVCINKWDLSPDFTKEIEEFCHREKIPLSGRIPFDRAVVESLVNGQPVLQYFPDSPVAQAIKALWNFLQNVSDNNSVKSRGDGTGKN